MPDQPQPQAEKRIIVDEDWKSQVQAEKEELKRKGEAKASGLEAEDQPTAFPPASLSVLLTSLGMQAMMALGLITPTGSPASKPRLGEAKHLIDTLAVLEEKTAGNRTPEESALLENLLHELRLSYVMLDKPTPDPT